MWSNSLAHYLLLTGLVLVLGFPLAGNEEIDKAGTDNLPLFPGQKKVIPTHKLSLGEEEGVIGVALSKVIRDENTVLLILHLRNLTDSDIFVQSSTQVSTFATLNSNKASIECGLATIIGYRYNFVLLSSFADKGKVRFIRNDMRYEFELDFEVEKLGHIFSSYDTDLDEMLGSEFVSFDFTLKFLCIRRESGSFFFLEEDLLVTRDNGKYILKRQIPKNEN